MVGCSFDLETDVRLLLAPVTAAHPALHQSSTVADADADPVA